VVVSIRSTSAVVRFAPSNPPRTSSSVPWATTAARADGRGSRNGAGAIVTTGRAGVVVVVARDGGAVLVVDDGPETCGPPLEPHAPTTVTKVAASTIPVAGRRRDTRA
jgi:hypothetical protein